MVQQTATAAQPVATAPAEKTEQAKVEINIKNENKSEGESVKTTDILLLKMLEKKEEMPYPQNWPDKSTMVTCAYCKQTVKTKVNFKAGKKTGN